MTEEYDDDDSYEYYSDYEDSDSESNHKISYNQSPYSRTPLPAFNKRELEASKDLRKWLQDILGMTEDDISAFIENKKLIDCGIPTGVIDGFQRLDVSNKNSCRIQGDSDEDGKPHGEAEILNNNGDHFCGHFKHGSAEGEGRLVLHTGEVFSGRFEEGRLEGEVREELDSHHLIRRVNYSRGVRHGPFIEYRADKQFLSIGRFLCGKKTGACWTATRGGGLLVGEVTTPRGQSESLHHGTGVFLYPDLVTAIQGEFSHGRMLSGRLVHVTKFCLTGIIPELEVSSPDNEQSRELYHYQPAGSLCISRTPLLRDPFECRYVFVSESGAGAGAGEGLFAKTKIARGQLCALFNGVRQRRLNGQALYETEWSDYRIGCGAETDLDILPGQERLENYRATLAHKVCHSFSNNCSFAQFWHPRFGNIMSVVADRDIKAGEELCVSYNYKLDFAPLWYSELWARHCHSQQKIPDNL